MDYYWTFVQGHIVRGKDPTAYQSRLGYLLFGPLPDTLSEPVSSALVQITSVMFTEEPAVPNLEKFWSVEAIGTETVVKSSDLMFLQSYQQSFITQTAKGTYIAGFLWKVDKPHLASNFNTCKKRTRMLITKLRKTPDLLQMYSNNIKEQKQRGFIERVHDDDNSGDVHYLPHHPVKKESNTTPLELYMTVVVEMVTQQA